MAQQQQPYVLVPYCRPLLNVYNDVNGATPDERRRVATLIKVSMDPSGATPGEKSEVTALLNQAQAIEERQWDDNYRNELIERHIDEGMLRARERERKKKSRSHNK